jgi:hypothetical protein
VPGDNEGLSPLGQAMTMDEIGASLEGDEKPPVDLTTVKAEGDAVPEAYRGKSVDEIIKMAEGARTQMNESVQAAKEARESAQRAAEMAGRGAPPPPEEKPKELTREEIKAIYDEDPMKALEIMETQLLTRVTNHVESRIAPLTDGTVNAAENWARQEYADEFELFGDKIKGMIDSIPNKQVFSTKKGWEDAIAYVRGQKGNFEKFIEHKNNKNNSEELGNARERERASAGFSGRTTVASSTRRETSSRQDADMGDEERQIAQRFINDGTFKDMNEYRKWQKMGG